MSRTRPKEKRRGGARDESIIYIDYTRDELFDLLEQLRRKCQAIKNDDRFDGFYQRMRHNNRH